MFDPISEICNSKAIKNNKREREKLFCKYSRKIKINENITRSIVSYQSNKLKPYHKWFKFKEAFSEELVKYFINQYRPIGIKNPSLLDPFAGTGTALVVAAQNKWKATGIELLPVAVASIRAKIIANYISNHDLEDYINKLKKLNFSDRRVSEGFFNHINITRNAFSEDNEIAIANFKNFLHSIIDTNIRYLFWFAGMSVLEDVSFTRKDGQYLRWDRRAPRNQKSRFNKGKIYDFKLAVLNKIMQIHHDIDTDYGQFYKSNVKVKEGSCLAILPSLPEKAYHLVITSPPYCNRYDYTRTYALELAYMNLNEEKVKNLRQSLLSSTVENKSKLGYLKHIYRDDDKNIFFQNISDNFNSQKAVQEVLDILYRAKNEHRLNNNNIPTLIENYLFEMNIVVNELYRVLAPLGRVVMVNDNVQYNGEEIPIDLILSNFAEKAGFNVDHIWILKKGKGNSSQQMGLYGRKEIRKCVYVWTKPRGFFK